MKKWMAAILTCAMVFSMGTTAFAKGNIYVDLVEAKGASPQIVNDRTMVPVRAITEMLGYDVKWIQEKQQVEVCDPDTGVPVIIMNIDSKRAYYTKYEPVLGDGVGVEKILDAPATLIHDRTYVPLRFISEAVGYTVDYNVDTADVYLFSPQYNANHSGEGKGDSTPTQKPSGVWDDGIGVDNPSGVWDDGVGSVVPLTNDEMVYVCDQTTNSWLKMSEEEKDAYVVLVGRWWEERDNFIVPDYDEMVSMLDHQSETYYRNGVDLAILITACELYDIDLLKYARTEY